MKISTEVNEKTSSSDPLWVVAEYVAVVLETATQVPSSESAVTGKAVLSSVATNSSALLLLLLGLLSSSSWLQAESSAEAAIAQLSFFK
jgi:hypothetical protein